MRHPHRMCAAAAGPAWSLHPLLPAVACSVSAATAPAARVAQRPCWPCTHMGPQTHNPPSCSAPAAPNRAHASMHVRWPTACWSQYMHVCSSCHHDAPVQLCAQAQQRLQALCALRLAGGSDKSPPWRVQHRHGLRGRCCCLGLLLLLGPLLLLQMQPCKCCADWPQRVGSRRPGNTSAGPAQTR